MMVKTKEWEYPLKRKASFKYISIFALEKSTRFYSETLTVLNGQVLFLIWTWTYHIIHVLYQIWQKVEYQRKTYVHKIELTASALLALRPSYLFLPNSFCSLSTSTGSLTKCWLCRTHGKRCNSSQCRFLTDFLPLQY